MTQNKSLWLIGVGPMAQDYANVISALGWSYEAIGRGDASASAFESATGHSALRGGIDNALSIMPAPENAIVAVGVEQLFSVAASLVRNGVRKVLLEKPGGINRQEICKLNTMAVNHGAEIFIAYNRRFYSSVRKAKELISEDGEVLSIKYEFTEWAHKIAPLDKPLPVKEHWLLANSTHVIDLAFHLGGKPATWQSWCAGSLDWHKSAARFCGAGITENGAMFSYLSDWQAPGRWSVEVMTRQHRLILCPMEELQVIKLGSIRSTTIDEEDFFDTNFKPGLYRQTESFLNKNYSVLCTLSEQLANVEIYSKMAGYY